MQSFASIEPVKALLFDVDGTLIDGIQMVVNGLGDTYEKFTGQRPSDESIQSLIGVPLKQQMTHFGLAPVSDEELQELIQYTISRYEFHDHLCKDFDPAVDALIASKKAGFRTALITSRNQQELDELKTSFRGWDFCDEAICASHVENPKPDPESVNLALGRFQLSAHEAVMIGDSIYDLKAGQGAGTRVGAVLYGAGKKEDLLALAPDYVFTTPEDLMEWVNQLIEQKANATEETTRIES